MDSENEVIADVDTGNSDDETNGDVDNEAAAVTSSNPDDVTYMDSNNDIDNDSEESKADTIILDFDDYSHGNVPNPDLNGADVACSLRRDAVTPADLNNAIRSEECMTYMAAVPNVYYKPCGHYTFCEACHKKMLNDVLTEGGDFICQMCHQYVNEVFII
ncbi:uncharacterized protein LOC130669388 [Microplitis mediator]|uniref:uncharacterized protein LOC130669388 n=1 Tax=Microplitis mediator TaxID=375433 RepID=UPI002556F7D3|nr:uncharacterized protein LOC130669388 [Microplitis mediator]XP_057328249.1 uncharacterized protein LOC130669388 [Microplitis mediator]